MGYSTFLVILYHHFFSFTLIFLVFFAIFCFIQGRLIKWDETNYGQFNTRLKDRILGTIGAGKYKK